MSSIIPPGSQSWVFPIPTGIDQSLKTSMSKAWIMSLPPPHLPLPAICLIKTGQKNHIWQQGNPISILIPGPHQTGNSPWRHSPVPTFLLIFFLLLFASTQPKRDVHLSAAIQASVGAIYCFVLPSSLYWFQWVCILSFYFILIPIYLTWGTQLIFFVWKRQDVYVFY